MRDSYTEGKSLASLASSYIGTNGANSLFKSYFGSTSVSEAAISMSERGLTYTQTSTVRNKFNVSSMLP